MLLILICFILPFSREINSKSLPCTSPKVLLATASLDNSIRIWDLDEGSMCFKILKGHTERVRRIIFSEDLKTIYSASWDKTVKIWNVSTGTCEMTLFNHSNIVRGLDISSDGTMIASGGDDKKLLVWSPKNYQLIRQFNTSFTIFSVIFSPSSDYLFAVGEGGILSQFNVKLGSLVKENYPHKKTINCLAMSEDGSYLITGSDDKTLKIIEVKENFNVVRTLSGHNDIILGLALSPDNKYLASSSADNSIIIWEFATGKLLKTLLKHGGWVRTVHFSPDGKYLLSGSDDNFIIVWDFESGIQVNLFNPKSNYILDLKIGAKCLACEPKGGSNCSNCPLCNCNTNFLTRFEELQICSTINLDICKNCPALNRVCNGCTTSPAFFSQSSCVNQCPENEFRHSNSSICSSSCPSELWRVQETRTCESSCPGSLWSVLSTKSCEISCPIPYWSQKNTRTCEGICPINLWGVNATRTCEESCPTPLWGVNNSRICVNVCPISQFGDKNDNICKQCHPDCPSCFESAKNCSSCNYPKFLLNGSCVSSCPSPYKEVLETRSCEKTCPSETYFDEDKKSCIKRVDENNFNPVAVIAGSVAGGLFCIITITAVCYYRNKKRNNGKKISKNIDLIQRPPENPSPVFVKQIEPFQYDYPKQSDSEQKKPEQKNHPPVKNKKADQPEFLIGIPDLPQNPNNIQYNYPREGDMPGVNQEKEDGTLCKICMASKIETIFEDCGHACCCFACASKLITKECPICRKISNVKRIFLS